VHLLDDEVELAAGRLARREERADLPDVAAEPRDLLGDVDAIGEERDLLREPRGIERDAPRQLRDPLLEPGAPVLDRSGHEGPDPLDDRLDLREPRAEVGGERLALARPHLDEGPERQLEPLQEGGARRHRVDRPLLEPDDPVGGDHVVERRPARQPEPRLQLREGARVGLGEVDVHPRRHGAVVPAAPGGHLDAAPGQPLLDGPDHLDLEGGELAREARLHLAVLVVDRPDLDGELLLAGGALAGAEAGHAPDHGFPAGASRDRASSRSITGIPPSIRKARRQARQWISPRSSWNCSAPLQRGQARTSRRSGERAMSGVSVVRESTRRATPAARREGARGRRRSPLPGPAR
jgi:hypothetical protein